MIAENYLHLIKDNFDIFLDNMMIESSNLLTLLYSQNVITHHQYADIKSTKVEYHQVEKLLLFFMCDNISADAQFEVFLALLQDNDQDHILQGIIRKYDKNGPHWYCRDIKKAIQYGRRWMRLKEELFESMIKMGHIGIVEISKKPYNMEEDGCA